MNIAQTITNRVVEILFRINHEHVFIDKEQTELFERIRKLIKSYFDFLKNLIFLAGIRYAAIKGNSQLLLNLYYMSLLFIGVYLQSIYIGKYVYFFGRRGGKFRFIANAIAYTLPTFTFYVIANKFIARLVAKFAAIQFAGH